MSPFALVPAAEGERALAAWCGAQVVTGGRGFRAVEKPPRRPVRGPLASWRIVGASAFLWGACAPSSAPRASEDAGVVMAVPRPADAWLGADRSATFRAHVERIRRVQAGTHAPSSPPCPAPNPVAISAHHGTQAAPFLKICPPATLTDGTSLRHSGSDGLRQHVRSTATVYSDGGLSCSQVLSV